MVYNEFMTIFQETSSSKKGFREGFRAAAPTALGYLSIGIACGIVGTDAGLTAWQMGAMSLLIYGGSAQFAFCAMVVARADLMTMTATIFLVNLRHFLLNLHLTTIFTKTNMRENLAIASLVTDESYGVLLGEHLNSQHVAASWMHGNNLAGYSSWCLSVFLGALLGSYISDPKMLGLDFALIAMFVSIFESQLSFMIRKLPLKKIAFILSASALSYLGLSMLVDSSLSVLGATLAGCFTGVISGDR